MVFWETFGKSSENGGSKELEIEVFMCHMTLLIFHSEKPGALICETSLHLINVQQQTWKIKTAIIYYQLYSTIKFIMLLLWMINVNWSNYLECIDGTDGISGGFGDLCLFIRELS